MIPGKPIYNMREQPEPIKPPARHRKPANRILKKPQTLRSAANPAPGVSAIGELSSGDPANFRQQTEESIAAIERGLNGINRHARRLRSRRPPTRSGSFVKQAKAALASGDVDGAHTLAAKAKVLLDELTH